MNKNQWAVDLVEDTFQSKFDRTNYIKFIKSLLNEPDFTYSFAPRTGNIIPESFRAYVSSYERVAKYTDDEEKRVDILIVYLKRGSTVERARSMQRNFIAGYLLGRYGSPAPKEAALVAFVAPNREDWRFSLVKLETKLQEKEQGGYKAVDEFTPARRWSFLVGSHEKSHTAQRQFVPIMEDTDNNPSLAQLEGAFNIEKVTDEFFREYRRLFIATKDALDKGVRSNPKTKADFASKGIDTVNLAKKLLGQIIFLYYLQKKGWFGVSKEKKWGDGSKNFLRELFDKKHGAYDDFFNDVLEPLFYEALRIDRKNEDYYYKRFKCRIPFLNGGLFDPMGNYDWEKTDIRLSNALFSHKTKDDPEGDGILDVFDLYNFTVKEDEPFEKEVAIDPELLGKAYEKFNAIRPDNYDEFLKALKSGKKGEESKFNKQYGVYYTPREIVHYMCQQSLINYLYSELNPNVVYQSLGDDQLDMVGNAAKGGQMDMSVEHRPMAEIAKEEIALLIQHGESWRENEERVETTGKETTAYSYKTPESIRENASLIDEKLAAIKVCDPAVGSGAFPVGMMSEIVRARDVLKTWTKTKKTVYDFKRECIENSLYGVDIDAGAVEIAKLRLWLSLIVDEEDIQNIKPLPNLDYKIVQGNSLIEILTEDFLVADSDVERSKILLQLKDAKDELFNLASPNQKEQKRHEIEDLMRGLFENYRNRQIRKLREQLLGLKGSVQLSVFADPTIQKGDKAKARTLEEQINTLELVHLPDKTEHFEWHINFSEVFDENGGFDVLIANPPYGAELKEEQKKYLKTRHENIVERIRNTFLYFLGEAYKQSKANGTVCFILPNELLFQIYMTKARKFFLENSRILFAINLGEDVFDAIVPTCVIAMAKSKQVDYSIPVSDLRKAMLADLPQLLVIEDFPQTTNKKILAAPNCIFSFDGSKSELINRLAASFEPFENYCEDVANGIATSCDEVYIVSKKTANDNDFEKEYLKECIRGGQFNRFYCPDHTGDYVLYITDDFDFKKGKNVYHYLSKNKKLLTEKSVEKKQGNRPWQILFRGRYEGLFIKPKILFRQTGDSIIASVDRIAGYYCINSVQVGLIKPDYYAQLDYLTGLLNSKLITFYYREISQEQGRVLAEVKPQRIRSLPIAKASLQQKKAMDSLVERILAAKRANPQADTKELEKDIDLLVYDLYGLTTEERDIVEGRA
jgi:hypothetical protein